MLCGLTDMQVRLPEHVIQFTVTASTCVFDDGMSIFSVITSHYYLYREQQWCKSMCIVFSYISPVLYRYYVLCFSNVEISWLSLLLDQSRNLIPAESSGFPCFCHLLLSRDLVQISDLPLLEKGDACQYWFLEQYLIINCYFMIWYSHIKYPRGSPTLKLHKFLLVNIFIRNTVS